MKGEEACAFEQIHDSAYPMLKVGDKMSTPVGEGTITAIKGTSVWVTVPPLPGCMNVPFVIEFVPPEPERGPHCDWCGCDVDKTVAYQDECGDYYCDEHTGEHWT